MNKKRDRQKINSTLKKYDFFCDKKKIFDFLIVFYVLAFLLTFIKILYKKKTKN
jgi:hypothetical protein